MKLKTPNFQRKDQAPAPMAAAPAPMAAAAPVAAPPAPAPAPVSPLRRATPVPSAPARQRNAAVMVAGMVFVLIAAALAVSVANSFDDSIEVLVAANPIAEGQTMVADDFRVVQIAAGEGDIQAVSPADLDELVGRIAAGPIGSGSMIHPAQFADASSETLVVVGAALEPDQFPVGGVKPGDLVRLIEVADKFDDVEGFSTGNDLGIGEVTDAYAFSPREMHFSIRVSESIANVVAQRVTQDRLTIALVDQSITLEQVDPLDPATPLPPLELDVDGALDEDTEADG